MKILVLDDTLGHPMMVSALLEQQPNVSQVVVASSLKEVADQTEVAVVLLGGRLLRYAKELRELFPSAHIIGRCPFIQDEPLNFFPWGDELRDPTLPLTRLLQGLL